MSTPDLTVLAYGGGTQSAALALMSASGQLPRLDAVIFADTQGEMDETYEYAEYVQVRLAKVDIPFITVTAGNLEAHLLSEERTSANPTPPAYVLNPDGTRGRTSAYRCSLDFKRRMVTRETKKLCGPRGAWKHKTVEQWMGFSADELGRMKSDDECRCSHMLAAHTSGECKKCRCAHFDRWRINKFPLAMDLRFRRADTIAWFSANGHPTPPRSACFFCPASSNERWAELKAKHPDKWERACHIDESIRHGGAFNRRGGEPLRGQLFLHRSWTPLRDADLRSKEAVIADSGQGALFDVESEYGCGGESCWT